MSQKLSLWSLFATKIVRGDPIEPLFLDSLATKIVLSLLLFRQGEDPFSCVDRKQLLIAILNLCNCPGPEDGTYV